MRRYVRSKTHVTAFLLFLSLPLAPATAQGTDEPYGDEYRSGDFGRVRFEDHGFTLVRAETETDDAIDLQGSVNTPIYPGDRLSTAHDQRVEVQLAAGSLVRLDRTTDLAFLSLPDPYAEFADNAVLQLGSGTIRMAAQVARDEEFRVDTPASSIYLLGDADLRVEVGRSGRTRVWSRRGVAEVVGNGASVILRGGMQTEVHPGLAPDEPSSFNTFTSDGFDFWVAQRENAYRDPDRYAVRDGRAYEAVPAEIRPYYTELSAHGNWVLAGDYGYVWYPNQRVADWRPYYYGHWNYGPHGYFWVSNEPWGWAPYHYGRWNYLSDYGWCWVPGRVFAGAWVSWSWGSAYLGWSPLDFWNRPAYVHGYHHGYYDPYAWTFVSYTHIAHRHHRNYTVRLDQVAYDLPRAAVTSRAPRVSPGRLAASAEGRRQAYDAARADPRRIAVPAKTEPSRARFGELEAGQVRRTTYRPSRDLDAVKVEAGRRSGPTEPPASGASRGRAVTPRYPSRLGSGRAGATAERRSAAENDPPNGTPVRPSVTRPERRNFERRSDAVDDRDPVRDIYRRMAQPRQTTPRAEDGENPTPAAPNTDARTERGRAGAAAERAPRQADPPPAQQGAAGRSGAEAKPAAPPREGAKSGERPAPRRPESARSNAAGANSTARRGASGKSGKGGRKRAD